MSRMRVPVNHLRKGMVIADDVYTNTGVVLVTGGSAVTKDVAIILIKHFVEYVMVEVKDTQKTIPIQDNSESRQYGVNTSKVNVEQYREFESSFKVAENVLADNLKDIVYNNREVNAKALLDATNNIIQKSNSTTNLCDMLLLMKKNTEDLYSHCLNVALFGQILGKWLNCTAKEIEDIAVAGLMHDLGVLKYSDDAFSEFTFRDELDGNGYEKHVLHGYNMIKDQNLNDDVKKAILTHHERLDGQGFPMRVRGDGINKISRIVAVADTYDTFTMHELLVEPMSVFVALKKMEELSYNKLDSGILMTFISHIADTFIQHHVLLSNGRIGQIVMINKYDITKPLVQINKEFIDLSRAKDIFIREILD